MTNRFVQTLAERSLSLRRARPEILQVNVGKLCNLTCVHCHVNAGPKRKEIMSRETAELCIRALEQTDIPTVDITGGAPELAPCFRYLVEESKRGTAYGAYYFTIGVGALPASLLLGFFWKTLGTAWAFSFGAAMALTAALLAILLMRDSR